MGIFKKPEKTKKALKVLLYGDTGTGKSTFALSFPDNAIVDSEDGYTFYKENPNIALMVTTNSIYDLEEALDEVENELLPENAIKTLTIDSVTKFYNNLQVVQQNLVEKRAKRKGQDVDDANLSQREWGKIKNIMKRINDTQLMLASQGINIVNVAQEKEIKEKRGDNWVVVGYKPDTANGIAFDYDIILRLTTEEDKKTKEVKYFGEVLKDRTQKYKKHDVIENPSFKNWEDVYNNNINKKEAVVNFRSETTKDEERMANDEASAKDLAETIKTFIKSADDTQKVQLTKAMKSLEINIKDLAGNSVESLKELVDLIETL